MWSIEVEKLNEQRVFRVSIWIEDHTFRHYLEDKLKIYPVVLNFEQRYIKLFGAYQISIDSAEVNETNRNLIQIEQGHFYVFFPYSFSHLFNMNEEKLLKLALNKWLKEEQALFLSQQVALNT
ncbi:hypothetical protein [Rummeliibacillus stabekisii]|uniref:hypothetical protein n=1 Tax=Rummeliibacillus stabekisii TaxID=241244 RepID=UPI0037165432